MIETKYNVLIGKQVVASSMTLDNAVIFLKGLFNEYYNDKLLAVTIEVDKNYFNDIETRKIEADGNLYFLNDEE